MSLWSSYLNFGLLPVSTRIYGLNDLPTEVLATKPTMTPFQGWFITVHYFAVELRNYFEPNKDFIAKQKKMILYNKCFESIHVHKENMVVREGLK